jgi:hypothetical protein
VREELASPQKKLPRPSKRPGIQEPWIPDHVGDDGGRRG